MMAVENMEVQSEEENGNETAGLLSEKPHSNENKEDEERLKTLSVRCLYFTSFVNAIGTTIVYSSLWSYLKIIDIETTTWYLGLVHAAFNGGELCCILLYGIWVQFRPAIEPLTFSLVNLIVGSALYSWANSFGSYGKVAVLVSRIFVGCASGNDVVITVLLCEQTKLRERTTVMANYALSQAIGFIAGPVIQSCFIPVGISGYYIKGLSLHINMYTMAGFFCILLGIVNLVAVWIYGRREFREEEIETDNDMVDDAPEDQDSSPKERENGSGSHPDLIAIFTVLIMFFFMRHVLVFVEVMFAPMAMDLYALSQSDTLLYVGLILAIAGVCSIFIFVATDKLADRVGDRVTLLISAALGLLGFAVLWPVSSTYPKLGHYYTVQLNTTSGIEYYKKSTLGCSPEHTWCTTTPVITLTQVGISLAFILISYPIASTILPSVFTKVIKPGRQGPMVSLLNIAGNLSRILGPAMFTSLYAYYGPKLIIGMMDAGLSISLLLAIIFYKRIIPYKEYVKLKKFRS